LIRISVALLLGAVPAAAPDPASAQSDADASLAAIVRHPRVQARLKASTARLAWRALPVEDGRACYALQEDHPDHMVTIGQYCLDRRTSKILEYDVVTDSYSALP
jgi:hypothetical protein